DRRLLVADHANLLEIDPERRQVFRDIADVLILGAAGKDFIPDHQQRGGDVLLGCGRSCRWHVVTEGWRPAAAGPPYPAIVGRGTLSVRGGPPHYPQLTRHLA